MAYRSGSNRNNRGYGNYGGGSSQVGGGSRMNISPWESQNSSGSYGSSGGNMNQALNLANNLLNNFFRNQNPQSLLDLPRGGSGGGGGGRNRSSGMGGNRNGGGGGGGNRSNRRSQGGFRGSGGGSKSGQKQGGGGGIRKQNAIDRARKVLAKNANKKKDSASGEKKTESRESQYLNIHNDMFYCHLCKKHMWDASSFENHIKGRAHLAMRDGIEESYRLKANMLRQEAKIAELLKSIELDRQKKHPPIDYCTMCDLNFHGHISAHRKSEGHLLLKKFLHPRCVECNKEFPTRIDYDTHLLSPDHLRKASEKNVRLGETKPKTLPINTEEQELKDVRPPQKRKKKPAPKAAADSAKDGAEEGGAEVKKEEGTEDGEGEEHKDEDGAADGEQTADETKEGEELNESTAAATEAEEEEEVPLPVDPEDCIVDYNDGDQIPVDVDKRLPKYNWTRPVGANLISKLDCFECGLCGKYFDTEKTAEVHSRTVTHHRNFLKFINEKASFTKFAQKRAAAALEENERKKRKLEEKENGEGEDAEGEGEGEGVEVKQEETENSQEENHEADGENGEDGNDGNENNEYDENEDALLEGADEGGENGDDAEVDMEEEEEQQPEPEPEPEPVKEEPKKVETPKAATPVKQQAETPAKSTPAGRNQGKAAATPRNRGRGRSGRY